MADDESTYTRIIRREKDPSTVTEETIHISIEVWRSRVLINQLLKGTACSFDLSKYSTRSKSRMPNPTRDGILEPRHILCATRVFEVGYPLFHGQISMAKPPIIDFSYLLRRIATRPASPTTPLIHTYSSALLDPQSPSIDPFHPQVHPASSQAQTPPSNVTLSCPVYSRNVLAWRLRNASSSVLSRDTLPKVTLRSAVQVCLPTSLSRDDTR